MSTSAPIEEEKNEMYRDKTWRQVCVNVDFSHGRSLNMGEEEIPKTWLKLDREVDTCPATENRFDDAF